MRKKLQKYFLLLYFLSELCLEQALTIHAFLTQGVCPYTDLQAGKGTSMVLGIDNISKAN